MSLGPQFFDDFYACNGPDPWGFADRWYERRKRDVTLACLPRERFARALEVGCSIGVLTAALAPRCDSLLATDLAEAAVAAARERLRPAPHVRVERSDAPEDVPDGRFDLVVVSEVLYYLDPPALDRVLGRLVAALDDDGVLLACHWRHPVAEYPAGGDDVHAALERLPGLARTVRHVEEDFLLDVLSRDGRGVAARTGLLGGPGA